MFDIANLQFNIKRAVVFQNYYLFKKKCKTKTGVTLRISCVVCKQIMYKVISRSLKTLQNILYFTNSQILCLDSFIL